MDIEYTPMDFIKNVFLEQDFSNIKLKKLKKGTQEQTPTCKTCVYYWTKDGTCHFIESRWYHVQIKPKTSHCEYYQENLGVVD